MHPPITQFGKTTMRFNSAFALRWILVFALALTTGACATFRGLGPLSAPGSGSATFANENGARDWDSEGSDDEEHMTSAGPTITWNGERRYIRPEEPIKFDWPVDEARLTRGFLLGGKRSHWGLDLANVRGTPILASAGGMVIYAGRAFRGYGNLVVIEHNSEWATLYSHLHKIEVKEGQVVKQGERIGTMGRTGRATGVHLHFEIRHNRQPVNPLAYLPEGF